MLNAPACWFTPILCLPYSLWLECLPPIWSNYKYHSPFKSQLEPREPWPSRWNDHSPIELVETPTVESLTVTLIKLYLQVFIGNPLCLQYIPMDRKNSLVSLVHRLLIICKDLNEDLLPCFWKSANFCTTNREPGQMPTWSLDGPQSILIKSGYLNRCPRSRTGRRSLSTQKP